MKNQQFSKSVNGSDRMATIVAHKFNNTEHTSTK